MGRLTGILAAVTLASVVGCSSSNPDYEGDGTDGDVPGPDGTLPDGTLPDGTLPDGTLPDGTLPDGIGPDGPIPDTGTDWGPTPDGGFLEVTCQGHLYACGNLLDDDGDTLTDWEDGDCLGPCDNNEGGYYLEIPGGDSAPCKLDCYFDQDQGSGNDQCYWDHRCDPLEPDWNPACAFSDPPPPSATCPENQTVPCLDFCLPLVPNGCDCFGCCELPGGSGNWVFIGSLNGAGEPTCTLADGDDHERCHPCTPVEDCLNGCGPCELCLGRTELPPWCFPDDPDGGTDASWPDGYPDGWGDGDTPPDRCAPGIQPCGLPGDDPCPAGYYCITGCCQMTIM
ncbi:MAG: hypothetical protein JXB32_18895 [Deltaproteobacteria bacterium]|nr:hypothetical protein [Deltaproteobacteria bacterium]